MKRIHNYITLFVLTFAAVACIEEEPNPGANLANQGDEVQFGLSLNAPSTKTIYGPEDEDNAAFPLYWSQGDVVKVASPQCVTGRQEAEYLVTPMAGQSYAEAMTKVGDYGVQWGGTQTADFYSIYPSSGASFYALTENKVVAQLHIDSEQSSNLVLNGGEYISADMDNVIMYAQTNNVENGSTVNLKYIPYSTMLEFDLGIDQGIDEQGNLAKDEQGNPVFGSVKVVSMTLTAPTGVALAGDFNLTFNGNQAPIITKAGSNTNVISLHFTTYPILNETNRTLKVKLAMIPLKDVKLNDWTIEIDALDGENNPQKYTKTLTVDSNLAPGQIHKIKLPRFRLTTAAWNPSPDEWITQLYDYTNIYVTELSLPGAWYAGSPVGDGYQSTQSISDLWNAGIRAFAVETKCTTPMQSIRPRSAPTKIAVSGTADNATVLSSESGTNTLNTGTGNKYIYKEGSEAIYIQTVIEDIIDCLIERANDTTKEPEFAVLVLSYADGGKSGNRPVDYGAWLELLYEVYNKSLADKYKPYIYTEKLDASTTVSKVLNKLIIKINVDANIAEGGYVYQKGLTFTDERTYSYGDNLPATFSYNPFISQMTDVDYSQPVFSKMHYKEWGDGTTYRSYTTEYNETDFWWCFSSANRTQKNIGEGGSADSDIPTYAQRQKALRGMMEHSKDLTESKKHNIWFYFNAGGTETTNSSNETTSATTFASTMNEWLYELVKLKGNGGIDTKGVYGTVGAYVQSDPSPLGIVMFNQCLGSQYKGQEIINEIIEMNNKFKLLRMEEGTKAINGAYVSVGGEAF